MPFTPARDFLDPGIKPVSPALAGGCFTTELPGKLSVGLLQEGTTEDKMVGWHD